uniref:Uncharacterized protein n=1 Tax=Glossina pallidipes TaxID=7398 RepID=A0A1A9Z6W2_GLOPL
MYSVHNKALKHIRPPAIEVVLLFTIQEDLELEWMDKKEKQLIWKILQSRVLFTDRDGQHGAIKSFGDEICKHTHISNEFLPSALAETKPLSQSRETILQHHAGRTINNHYRQHHYNACEVNSSSSSIQIQLCVYL